MKPVDGIFCYGANHKSADVDFREKLFVSDELLKQRIPQALQELAELKELCVLSTCNRFEIYGYASGEVYQTATKALHLLRQDEGHDVSTYKDQTYFLEGENAITHALKVASSLDSLIVGETQITGQFKDALKLGQEVQSVGSILHRLGQEALAVTKKIRHRTAIGAKTVSISHAAIDLAKRVFGNIAEHRFLIVGAGEMSRLAAQYAASYNPVEIMVANRTGRNAEKLVEQIGTGSAHELDELEDLLKRADIIISCTAASQFVIQKEMVKRAQREKRGTSFFVDIAIPRDIDPKVGELEDVYLFEVDDLQQVVDENIQERKRAASQAQKLVYDAVDQFVAWMATMEIKPILSGYRKHIDTLVQKEWLRTNKKGKVSFSEEQQDAITRMLSSIVGKMTGELASQLQENTGVDKSSRLEDPVKSDAFERKAVLQFIEKLTQVQESE